MIFECLGLAMLLILFLAKKKKANQNIKGHNKIDVPK